MGKLIKGVHHIAIKAHDFDKSFAFYTQTLGFDAPLTWNEGDDRGCMLNTGNDTFIELFAGRKEEAPIGIWMHLAFLTEDVNAAYEAAVAAGAYGRVPPQDSVIPAREGGVPVRIAFVVGFDGEDIEFYQLL